MEENVPPANLPPSAPPPPPPIPPPPIIRAAPPANPPRRGRGWMVFALILLVLLGFSMLYNLGTLVSHALHGRGTHYAGRTAGPKLEEIIREDNESANKIALIEVKGIITSASIDQGGFNMVDVVRAQLQRAQADDRVKAVI